LKHPYQNGLSSFCKNYVSQFAIFFAYNQFNVVGFSSFGFISFR
jgi:hypothetical protein